jgi:hypothetical protein
LEKLACGRFSDSGSVAAGYAPRSKGATFAGYVLRPSPRRKSDRLLVDWLKVAWRRFQQTGAVPSLSGRAKGVAFTRRGKCFGVDWQAAS